MTETTTTTAVEQKPAINVKQQVAINNIISGIASERPELNGSAPKFETVLENGNVFLMAENYPTIKLGRDGGIDIPDLRSFSDPLHAAVHADELVKKQNDRDAKKQADAAAAATKATAPVDAAPAGPVLVEKKAFETGAETGAEVEESSNETTTV